VNLVWGLCVVVTTTAVAIVAMLLVRRGAPEGSYFNDGDRAAGVFGVLATGFSVLLGLIVFLAFSSYDQARSGAETEALLVSQQLETAQILPRPVSGKLSGQLVCYARSVAGPQWEKMQDGTLGDQPNPWGVQLFRTLRTVKASTPEQQAAYGKWLDQTSDREQARSDRIHGAVGVIPAPLWVVLFVISAIIFVFMLFFADSGEGAITQALLIGSVMTAITVLLLLVQMLDHPFRPGVGGLKPVAMERTLRVIDAEARDSGIHLVIPCDARGEPL
jgi:hypothetical protein